MYISKLKNLLTIKSVLKTVLLILTSVHQSILKPLFGSQARCRFQPSCSAYVNSAFEKHKPFKAFKLSFLRIIKCHPFGSYGYDPVPGDLK